MPLATSWVEVATRCCAQLRALEPVFLEEPLRFQTLDMSVVTGECYNFWIDLVDHSEDHNDRKKLAPGNWINLHLSVVSV